MQTQAYDPLELVITAHAGARMGERRIRADAVEAAVRHGRIFHVGGAEIHVIGKKDVMRHLRRGVDLAVHEGVHVVCSPAERVVLTVYRNKDFRGLRPRHRNMAAARRRKCAVGVGN